MKITTSLTILSTILFAAGCAHDERHSAQFDDTLYQPAITTENLQSSQSTTVGASVGENSSSATVGAMPAAESNASAAQISASDSAIENQIRQSLTDNADLAPIAPN